MNAASIPQTRPIQRPRMERAELLCPPPLLRRKPENEPPRLGEAACGISPARCPETPTAGDKGVVCANVPEHGKAIPCTGRQQRRRPRTVTPTFPLPDHEANSGWREMRGQAWSRLEANEAERTSGVSSRIGSSCSPRTTQYQTFFCSLATCSPTSSPPARMWPSMARSRSSLVAPGPRSISASRA